VFLVLAYRVLVWAVIFISFFFVDSTIVDIYIEIELLRRIHPFLLGAVVLCSRLCPKKKTLEWTRNGKNRRYLIEMGIDYI
jgi:hypothetical protein